MRLGTRWGGGGEEKREAGKGENENREKGVRMRLGRRGGREGEMED